MDNLTAITLTVTTERLARAVELLKPYDPKVYSPLRRTLSAELDRRRLGAAEHPIVIARRHIAGLPFAVKEALRIE